MKKLNLPGQLRGHERERIDSWKILMAIILGEVLRIHELPELNWLMVNGSYVLNGSRLTKKRDHVVSYLPQLT